MKKKESKKRQEERPATVEQLVAAMMALGKYAGKNSEAEHKAEAERLGGLAVYRMFLANALLGLAETEAMFSESAALSSHQLLSAHHQALTCAGAGDDPGKLLDFLRWRTLRIEGPLREIAQRAEVGPLPLVSAHAAEGLQMLLGVCAAGQNLSKADPAALATQVKAAKQSLSYAVANIDIFLQLLARAEDLFSS